MSTESLGSNLGVGKIEKSQSSPDLLASGKLISRSRSNSMPETQQLKQQVQPKTELSSKQVTEHVNEVRGNQPSPSHTGTSVEVLVEHPALKLTPEVITHARGLLKQIETNPRPEPKTAHNVTLGQVNSESTKLKPTQPNPKPEPKTAHNVTLGQINSESVKLKPTQPNPKQEPKTAHGFTKDQLNTAISNLKKMPPEPPLPEQPKPLDPKAVKMMEEFKNFLCGLGNSEYGTDDLSGGLQDLIDATTNFLNDTGDNDGVRNFLGIDIHSGNQPTGGAITGGIGSIAAFTAIHELNNSIKQDLKEIENIDTQIKDLKKQPPSPQKDAEISALKELKADLKSGITDKKIDIGQKLIAGVGGTLSVVGYTAQEVGKIIASNVSSIKDAGDFAQVIGGNLLSFTGTMVANIGTTAGGVANVVGGLIGAYRNSRDCMENKAIKSEAKKALSDIKGTIKEVKKLQKEGNALESKADKLEKEALKYEKGGFITKKDPAKAESLLAQAMVLRDQAAEKFSEASKLNKASELDEITSMVASRRSVKYKAATAVKNLVTAAGGAAVAVAAVGAIIGASALIAATPVGWALGGAAAIAGIGLGCYKLYKVMSRKSTIKNLTSQKNDTIKEMHQLKTKPPNSFNKQKMEQLKVKLNNIDSQLRKKDPKTAINTLMGQINNANPEIALKAKAFVQNILQLDPAKLVVDIANPKAMETAEKLLSKKIKLFA